MIKAEKIIIRSPNWVGDVVMATPAFRCIRENYSDAHITLLIKGNLKNIVDNSPWFDDTIQLVSNVNKNDMLNLSSRKVFGKGANEYLRLIYKLRIEKFDLGFLFPNSFSSALMIWMAGVRRRVGYKRDARSLFLTDGVERLMEEGKFKPIYMADYYLRLCTQAGCNVTSNKLELFISDKCEEKANSLLKKYNIDKKPFILINPGASYGSSKCWTPEGFARTADLLSEESSCTIVLVCGPGEARLTDNIESLARKDLINLAKESVPLDILKVLIKKSSLLITVDSGPRHFAVALNRPVVVLMGPTDPRYTESEYETGEVIREDIDCSPCHIKICPTDHRCMTMISPEKVVKAGMELINSPVSTNN